MLKDTIKTGLGHLPLFDFRLRSTDITEGTMRQAISIEIYGELGEKSQVLEHAQP